MQHVVTRKPTRSIAGIAFLLPIAAYAAGPSFDCAKASSDVEVAICGSTALMAADRDIADAYGMARRRLDRQAGLALVQDQRAFLLTRGYVLTPDNNRSAQKRLLESMQNRARFLQGIPAQTRSGFAGQWGSVLGFVSVLAVGNGYEVSINTVEPTIGRWVCDIDGTGTLVEGKLLVKNAGDRAVVQLSHDGELLKVETLPPPGIQNWHAPFCGSNGSLDGEYFPSAGAN
ncbi:hypothetical protein PQR66_09555 [Paraburkholderia agricolaris]|jgi:uncharacterized protein YecT (DUF1311 family)|uniref:Lysozyme inhibitor LprI N-terminal domain-containing protein n=1 Tax=Paraburkholderia agricolaris TaxID=2152888 RepID=A0ABW8ZKG4_9BURK